MRGPRHYDPASGYLCLFFIYKKSCRRLKCLLNCILIKFNIVGDNIIKIIIPRPSELSTGGGFAGSTIANDFKISELDILFKESDALAVKVLQTIKLTDQGLSSISFKDAIHSNADSSDVVQAVTKYFLDYDYSSTKPYKTLPNNQVTRVSDKVPIKALAQEIIGNRVVYGNYLDRHTSPNSIGFSAFATNKSINFDNYTQFTNHQLKQDRTYQVGFVLSVVFESRPCFDLQMQELQSCIHLFLLPNQDESPESDQRSYDSERQED